MKFFAHSESGLSSHGVQDRFNCTDMLSLFRFNEDAKNADHAAPQALGCRAAASLIHQQDIGGDLNRQCNGLCFPEI